MDFPDYNSPTALKILLARRELAMQKKFGQNFLVSEAARRKLVESLEIGPGSKVWEIGPGFGSITAILLEAGCELTLFEIDHGFIAFLRELFGDRVKIVQGDALKTWRTELSQGMPDRVFGNLPYNIATALIGDFAERDFRCERMVFTVQKEAADRMKAAPGGKDYSSFSVLCQSAFEAKSVLSLSPSSFYPQPNVQSTALAFTPRKGFPAPQDLAFFRTMVRALFASRRKTMRNNLISSGLIAQEGIEAAQAAALAEGFDLADRAETISPERLVALSDLLLGHAARGKG
jgi:16S rRNA (adenine1518-N6/adenine1519-N6)-dimethyltransferase